MSSKILLSFLGGCLALFLVMGITTNKSDAQVANAGKTLQPSSQLIAPFDTRDGRSTYVQITNTNASEPVNIHIQVLDAGDSCNECNYFDTLTPLDTMVIDLDDILSNEDPVTDLGSATTCEFEGGDTRGLLVVTPVLEANFLGDARAIAFNHMHGTVEIDNEISGQGGDPIDNSYFFNAVGRTAVLPNGASAADGTILDGAAAFLESILPGTFDLHYNSTWSTLTSDNTAPVFADAIFVAISDNYASAGGSRYEAEGADSPSFDLTTFNDIEQGNSCSPDFSYSCMTIVGVNASHPTQRTVITATDTLDTGLLISDCVADLASMPPAITAEDCSVICSSGTNPEDGYTILNAGTPGTADAYFGILGLSTSNFGGASHIFVR